MCLLHVERPAILAEESLQHGQAHLREKKTANIKVEPAIIRNISIPI